jgi:hypothetical protein
MQTVRLAIMERAREKRRRRDERRGVAEQSQTRFDKVLRWGSLLAKAVILAGGTILGWAAFHRLRRRAGPRTDY